MVTSLVYVERVVPASRRTALATVVHEPVRVRFWIATGLASCEGFTEPKKRTGLPALGVAVLSDRPTFGRTRTSTVGLAAALRLLATARYCVFTVARSATEKLPFLAVATERWTAKPSPNG